MQHYISHEEQPFIALEFGGKKKKQARAETKKRKSEIEAHLTVAIRRQDYSIALTKCFQNTVKLRERRNKSGE